MSLLMDALKKAELAKQAGQEAQGSEENLRLEPVDGAAAPDQVQAQNKNLPELPPQLEILDAEFMAHAESGKAAAAEKQAGRAAAQATGAQGTAGTPPKPQAARGRETQKAGRNDGRASSANGAATDVNRGAARQVFAAKQTESSRTGFYIAVGSVFVVGLAAIGGYVWWELQPKSGFTVPKSSPSLAQRSGTTQLQPASPPPPAAAAVAPLPAAAAPPSVMARERDEEEGIPRRPRASAPRPAEPESPIRISKAPLVVNQAAARGFDAFQAGDLDRAKAEYQRLLESEPRNGDALRGLAAVALRQGDASGAGEWYLRALEADPKDAVAHAGLIGLRGIGGDAGEPVALESRIKTLIAAQPDVGALHFALGNVYARQQRWSEAQQSFFRAFSAEPGHPDYAFNLAVSLDHLRQARLAGQYYQQALDLAAQRPAGFDAGQAAARLREIRR